MTPEEIFEAHYEAFKAQKIKFDSPNGKFKSMKEFKQYLLDGNISNAMWQKTAEHKLGVAQQIGLWSLLDFASKEAKKRFKEGFIGALEKIGIY